MSRLGAFSVTLAVVLALGAASCGGRADPFRLAIQVECQGAFEGFADEELAGAFLPLLERGAHLTGSSPSDGIEGASIGGRPVEVKQACTESLNPTYAVVQTRELLETWHPDAVVGSGQFAQDAFVMRDLAKRYPDVTFVLTEPPAQEATLYHPAPNVFRVVPDNAQSVAGLGAFAYRTLGWRRAAVVGWGYPAATSDDWELAAGFMAEFCALGGTATRDDGRAWTDPKGSAARYAGSVDGVAVLVAWGLPESFLREMAKRGGLSKRVVLGGWGAEANGFTARGVSLQGVVVASRQPLDAGPPAWRRYVAAFERAYPALPRPTSVGSVGYRNGVEAIATGLEAADGDVARLRQRLAAETVPTVPVASVFDPHRQAVSTVFLSRLGASGQADARELSVVPGVEQTFGGIFGPPASAPTAASSSCDQSAKPPPWVG
jgi:branched-chain amino acid transport system substrate-binding protein